MAKIQSDVTIPANGLLTEKQVAVRLALNVKTLRRWRWARRGIPWIKLGAGGAVRYDPAIVDAFIEGGRQPINHSAAFVTLGDAAQRVVNRMQQGDK